jgi:predicted dehydrogenase
VEKPLALSIEQCLACRKVFAEHKRIFQYGTMQRSQDRCRLACEIVRNGKIGKLKALEVVAPNGGAGGSTKEIPVPANLDYNTWLGPAPLKPYTADRCNPNGSYWIYDYSIGYLAGWGAHPLDLMVWGCDADLAETVTVEGTGVIPDKGLYDTVYNWDMKLRLGDVAMNFKPGSDSTKFIGTEGSVSVARFWIDAEPKSLLKWKPGPDDKSLVRSGNHYQNFVDCVKSRQAAVSPLDEAVRSDILSHLCNIAVRLKRKVTWDTKKETIVGDDEAVKMMHRDLRAPYTL